MKIRPPVVPVFSVLMVLSLIAPSFLTNSEATAAVSPAGFDVQPVESIADMGPGSDLSYAIAGDGPGVASIGPSLQQPQSLGPSISGDSSMVISAAPSMQVASYTRPPSACTESQNLGVANSLRSSFNTDRSAAGLRSLDRSFNLTVPASQYAMQNGNRYYADSRNVAPGTPTSAQGFSIALSRPYNTCSTRISESEVQAIRAEIIRLGYQRAFLDPNSTDIGVYVHARSDGRWNVGIVAAQYPRSSSIPSPVTFRMEPNVVSPRQTAKFTVTNAPANYRFYLSIDGRTLSPSFYTDSRGSAVVWYTMPEGRGPGAVEVRLMTDSPYYWRTWATTNAFFMSNSASISATVNKTVAEGGETVVVTGRGFRATEAVQIRWRDSSASYLKMVNANAQGYFQTTVTLPQVNADTTTQLYVRGFSSNLGVYTQPIRVNKALIDTGTLRLTPSTGPSGEYTAVYGTGFQGGETVEIRWGSDRGIVIGRMTVRGDGTYLGRITTRTGPPGSNEVYAVGLTSNYRAKAWYQITSSTPSMVLNTSHQLTSSGAVITVTGRGYQPNEIVHIRWVSQSGSLLGTVRANSSGAISGKITIPQVPNKNYQIFATGASSKRYGSVVHQVRNHVRTGSTIVSPNFGMSGQVVTVTGRGYQPGERVEIRWGSVGGRLLGYVTARSDGSYYGRVTIPVANAGPYNVVTVGTSSYRYSSGPYMVTANTTRSQLNVSHVNVRPGYVIMANGTGWTPGQRLELRWNGAKGQVLGYVTVRANGTWSGRVTIPTTSKPGTYYLVASTPSGFTSVRINVSGTSIASMPIGFIEDVATEEADTPAPEMIGTPMASPTVVPTEEAPVGTPGVVPDEESVGTPAVEPTEEVPVGTPTLEPAEEVVDEVPDGTPTSEPTEEVVDEVPDGTPSADPTQEPVDEAPDGEVDPDDSDTGQPDDEVTDEGSTDDRADGDPLDDGIEDGDPVIEVPTPAVHPVTIVVVDQHGAPVLDVCLEITDPITGGVTTVCDVTPDGVTDTVQDGRIHLVPGVETGEYRIVVKNLPDDIIQLDPRLYTLNGEDGIDVRITVERQPPPVEVAEPPMVEEPEPVNVEEDEPDPPDETEMEPTDGPDPEPDSTDELTPEPETTEEPAA